MGMHVSSTFFCLLHLFGNFFEDCDEEHVGFADVDLSCSFLSWPLH